MPLLTTGGGGSAALPGAPGLLGAPGRLRAHLVRPRRWSLRARLLAALVALLAVVCLVVGAVSAFALQHSLVDRVDDQLRSAGGRALAGPPDADVRGPGRPGRGHGPYDPAQIPGQSVGTLMGTRTTGGDVDAYVLVDAEVPGQRAVTQALPGGTAAQLEGLVVGAAPRTVDLAGLGDYRVQAKADGDGDGSVVVVGLPLAAVHRTVLTLVAVQAGLSAGALLLAGLVGAVIVRRTLQPLTRVATLATHVTALPLERGEVELHERVPAADTDPRTEVGQVGAALNQLLDHVGGALTARHESETRVRQFVADASHELRTPLAAIRGYAELSRRSREPVPADVAHAIGRVESEATRMTTLVEDLLLLARLDSGRPLDHEPVDLTRLVVDAVSDASAAGPDHTWRLDLPDEPVEVVGDAARLHQVLVNLLANARAHTPPGSTVTASLTTGTPGEAVLAVLDDGPGIGPELLPHVFERFARGDGSRGRRAGSTGLGLAIVHAIVTASGGSVHVVSRPGRTAFLVRLPVPAPEPARTRDRAVPAA